MPYLMQTPRIKSIRTFTWQPIVSTIEQNQTSIEQNNGVSWTEFCIAESNYICKNPTKACRAELNHTKYACIVCS